MTALEFAGMVYTSSFTFSQAVDPGNHAALSAVSKVATETLLKVGDGVTRPPAATGAAGGRSVVAGSEAERRSSSTLSAPPQAPGEAARGRLMWPWGGRPWMNGPPVSRVMTRTSVQLWTQPCSLMA